MKYSCLPITAKDKQEYIYQNFKITVQALWNWSKQMGTYAGFETTY